MRPASRIASHAAHSFIHSPDTHTHAPAVSVGHGGETEETTGNDTHTEKRSEMAPRSINQSQVHNVWGPPRVFRPDRQ